ncbi:methylenetetrahydrofolate reductase [Phaeobacter italicus]|jgi:methylenetetrahydrofolate reductase (NADPH)|nr:methylenetetrahydrofolate reductase [Phaeobacter italicus]
MGMSLTSFWEATMALLNFKKRDAGAAQTSSPEVEAFLQNYSIEVMPRTAAKVDDFRDLLPAGTRVYIAHIEGTPIEEMVATAKRLNDEGFPVMPHFPARIIKDEATLADWIARYQGEADVKQALMLAGGVAKPHGAFDSSMQLLETGLFDKAGFTNLHVAGHPEGNKDIDPDGSSKNVDEALQWKQKFSERTDASMALATQFAFDAKPIIEWADGLKAAGVDLPIHIGIAGPAKLQTLIKFAIACGVGPSLKVLQKRAMDVSKLLLPYEPTDVIAELAAHKAANPDFNITNVHFFPLGGIKTNANWAINNGGDAAKPVNS